MRLDEIWNESVYDSLEFFPGERKVFLCDGIGDVEISSSAFPNVRSQLLLEKRRESVDFLI